jgi:EAL domain-containing protein (putative c-di-GMP-specific phosphodiesterase class I)
MILSFKSNSYNCLDGIIQGETSLEYEWVVECETSVLNNASTKKNTLNVRLLTIEQKDLVEEIEQLVCEKYKKLLFQSSLKDDVMLAVNIPTQYGHITIPIQTLNNKKLLTEHLKKGVNVLVKISPTHVWKSAKSCGIIWSIFDIIANIAYE